MLGFHMRMLGLGPHVEITRAAVVLVVSEPLFHGPAESLLRAWLNAYERRGIMRIHKMAEAETRLVWSRLHRKMAYRVMPGRCVALKAALMAPIGKAADTSRTLIIG